MSYCVHKVPRNGTAVDRLWLFPRCAKVTDDISISRPLGLRGMTSLEERKKPSYLGSGTAETRGSESGGLAFGCTSKLFGAVGHRTQVRQRRV